MLISFIVPVFNAKKTLQRCVSSILSQGLDEFACEILLVNDGSTDGSYEVCEELSEKHHCVRVISQRNAGLSAARNNGIQSARGDYLCFVDSDDSLIPGELVHLLDLCDGKNDLVRYWCSLVYPGSHAKDDAGNGSVLFHGSGLDYLRRFGLETFCWNYLYKKQFLLEKRLFLQLGIIGEDFPFMFDVIMANPHIVSVAQRIYLYNISPNSLSTNRTSEHSRRWVNDLMSSLAKIEQALEPFRDSDPTLFEKCQRSFDDKVNSLFSRMLSAQYSLREFRDIIASCKEKRILPQQIQINAFVSLLTRIPSLYPLARVVFNRLFLPFVYPKLNRYGQ